MSDRVAGVLDAGNDLDELGHRAVGVSLDRGECALVRGADTLRQIAARETRQDACNVVESGIADFHQAVEVDDHGAKIVSKSLDVTTGLELTASRGFREFAYFLAHGLQAFLDPVHGLRN